MINQVGAQMSLTIPNLTLGNTKGGVQGNPAEERTESAAERAREAQAARGGAVRQAAASSPGVGRAAGATPNVAGSQASLAVGMFVNTRV